MVPAEYIRFCLLGTGHFGAAEYSVRTQTCKTAAPEGRLDELFPDGRENADYSLPESEKGLAERFFWLLTGSSRNITVCPCNSAEKRPSACVWSGS